MQQSKYLPEGIIHHVLSFLGSTDQIRASVLSKDWLRAWQTCPALKFSDQHLEEAQFHPFHRESEGRMVFDKCHNCRQYRLKFQDHVNRTLLNYKGEHIEEFTLDIYYGGDEDSATTLDKWLEIAVKKGVQKLKLLLNRGRYTIDAVDAIKYLLSSRDRYTTDAVKYVLPGCILQDGHSLTDLALEHCRFPPCKQLFNGGNFLFFNNIKSLSLAYVYIEDEMFRLLLSACPLIYNLDIQLCEGLGRIKLVNLSRLKKLHMHHVGGESLSFEVDAPSLESLTIRYIIPRSRLLQLPASQNLRELILVRTYINNTFFADWTSKFPRLEILELDNCYGFKKINLESHSLKLIWFWLDTKMSSIELEIDAPNIINMKFTVTPETLQKVSFKGALPQHCVSDLYIYDCNSLSADVSWFLKLNELLSNLNPSQISLQICYQRPLSEHANFEDIPTYAAQLVEFGYSLNEFRAELACHLAFLDALFWACRPKHFVLHWGVDFNCPPVKCSSYEKFITELRNQVFSNFWHYLKKIEFHVYDNTGQQCCEQDYLHWLEASKIVLHLDSSPSSNLWSAEISEPLKPNCSSIKSSVMAGLAPEGYQLDACQCDAKMTNLFNADGEDFLSPYDEVYDSFESMGLQENLLRGIYAHGFEKPSAIQQRGIVPFCKGLDVIQQAQSGSGKTATLCSGILQQLDYSVVDCQALVLAPFPELARKIEKVMHSLGNYLGVKVHACECGASVHKDQRIFPHGVHVVVGTPECIFDMLRRQSLSLDYVKMIVLNQADEMISRGFKNQIYAIFRLLPPRIQVGVFLATMPPEAFEITGKLMNKPVRILVKLDEFALKGIKQSHVNAEKEETKVETLSDLSETDEAAIS